MSILSHEQAKQVALQLIDDIAQARDVDEACSIYGVFTTRSDHLMIGRYLMEPLTAAINLWLSGDRTLRVVNLVAVANASREEREAAEAEATRPLPHATNRSALASSSVPDIAQRMTHDSGIYGIPIPDDAVPKHTGFASEVGVLADVTAFYKDYMSTDGWIFDAEYSVLDPEISRRRKLGYCSTAMYCKPTDPVTTVNIGVFKADEVGDSAGLVILIMDLPNEELARAALTTRPVKPL